MQGLSSLRTTSLLLFDLILCYFYLTSLLFIERNEVLKSFSLCSFYASPTVIIYSRFLWVSGGIPIYEKLAIYLIFLFYRVIKRQLYVFLMSLSNFLRSINAFP